MQSSANRGMVDKMFSLASFIQGRQQEGMGDEGWGEGRGRKATGAFCSQSHLVGGPMWEP